VIDEVAYLKALYALPSPPECIQPPLIGTFVHADGSSSTRTVVGHFPSEYLLPVRHQVPCTLAGVTTPVPGYRMARFRLLSVRFDRAIYLEMS
jgi:hypothetical protein